MNDEDINDNFVGVSLKSYMISEKKGKYPFVIANTDNFEKLGDTAVEYT